MTKSWYSSPAYISALVVVLAIAGGIFLYPYLPFAQTEEVSEGTLTEVGSEHEQVDEEAKGLVLNMPAASGGGIAVNFAEDGSAKGDAMGAVLGEAANTLGDQEAILKEGALTQFASNTSGDAGKQETLFDLDQIVQSLETTLDTDELGQNQLDVLLATNREQVGQKALPQGEGQSRPNVSISQFARHLKQKGIADPFFRSEALPEEILETAKYKKKVTKTKAEQIMQFEQYLHSGQYKRIEHLIGKETEPYLKALFISELLGVRHRQERVSEANRWLDQLSAIYDKSALPREQALLLSLQAKAYAYLGNQKQANSMIEDSIRHVGKVSSEAERTALLCQLAGDQVEGNQIDAAERLLKKAYEYAEQLPDDFMLRSETYARLANAFAVLANFVEARFVQTRVVDAFLSEETKKEIVHIEQELKHFVTEQGRSSNIKPVELLKKVKQNADGEYRDAILDDF